MWRYVLLLAEDVKTEALVNYAVSPYYHSLYSAVVTGFRRRLFHVVSLVISATQLQASSCAAVREMFHYAIDSVDSSIDADTSATESILSYLSKGWFPQPPAGTQVGVERILNLVVIDQLSNLRSAAFANTREGFSTENPFVRSESDIKQRFSMANSTGETLSDYYRSDGLTLSKSVPLLWSILRAHASYDRISTVLYSPDYSKKYVTAVGDLRSIKEVNVLNIRQQRLTLGLTAIVPVYGIFIQSELVDAASHYYLSLGFNASMAVQQGLTQYVQIAGPKDAIRLVNGTDTVRVLETSSIETMKRVQTAVTVGVGWMVSFSRWSTCFEPFVTLPVHSLLRDASWYQIPIGVRLILGYDTAQRVE